jgi:hypothetical protein
MIRKERLKNRQFTREVRIKDLLSGRADRLMPQS